MKTDAERLARIERAVEKMLGWFAEIHRHNAYEQDMLENLDRADVLRGRSREAAALSREFSETKTEEGE